MTPTAMTELCRPPDSSVTRMFLVRHGSTEANERKPFVLQGCEIDTPLTAKGWQQAREVAGFLREVAFSAIYASPMIRAQQTASLCAESRGVTIRPVEALKECSVGRWQGLSWDEIHARDPGEIQRFLANPARERHPGGESYEDVLARVAPALNEILATHTGQNVLVVAHNMVNRAFLSHLLGMDLSHARRVRQTNCCVNIIHRSAELTDVVSVNSIWHLTES